jgi:hypothetical protein
MDLNSILAQFTGASQQRMTQANTLQQSYDADTQRISGLLTTNEQEASAVVQGASQVAAQQAQLDYTIGKAREANVAIAGMNPDDLNNEYVRSIAAYDASEQQRTALEQARTQEMRRVEQLASANLLENPLAYIAAQLQLPSAAAKHNSLLNQEVEATQRRDSAARNVLARTELIRAKDSIVAANTADTLLTINTSKAKLADQQAQITLRQAQADNISKLGARAMDSYRLAGDTFQVQSDLLNKQMTVQQWAENRAAQAASRQQAFEASQARLQDKKEQDAEEAWMNERLRSASASLGYQEPFTLRTIKFLPKAQQELLVKSALDGKFGGSLGEAVVAVQSLGRQDAINATNPGMGKYVGRTSNALRAYADEEARRAQVAGQKPKPADIAAAASQAYEFEVSTSAHSFTSNATLNSKKWNDDGVFNPYKPEYLALADAAEGGMLPQLQGNKLLPIIKTLKKDLAPAASNLRGQDMERLVQVLATQVSSGDLGLDVAARDLAAFHRVAAAKNLELYNYTQFGMPQQTSAIVTIPAVSAFGEAYKFDLMNPTSVKTNLARMAREQKLGTIGGIVDVLGQQGRTRESILRAGPFGTPQ